MVPFLILLFLSVESISLSHADNVDHSSGNTTHLHFYLHDTLSGPNPTAIPVVQGSTRYKGPGPFGFGTIIVIDDVLTEGPSLTTNAIGRAQGFYTIASLSGSELLLSMNILLTEGEFNASTVTVLGRDNMLDSVRELPVIGGSGKFRMARGYTLFKTYSANASTGDVVLEVDLYVTDSTSPNIDELVPSSDDTTSNGDNPSSSSSASDSNKCLHLNVVMIFVVSCFIAKYLLVVI
ncbi:Dirigent protein [Rhynchospora pubera]|uniref:Dirigent protein n=1 Tax=Rhynchospora pubera TaxID=906938 RepID=A0AAV8HML5_9POAL|nr:Dirigent protein [Rhynchospora pubera]